MKPLSQGRVMVSTAVLFSFLLTLVACGGGGGDDGGSSNTDPVINSASVTPLTADINQQVTFSWSVSDADGDTLTCNLDIENDGTDDYTVNDCANNTSQTHSYPLVGVYNANLTLSDGNGGQVSQLIGISVTDPAVNTAPTITSYTANPSTADTSTPVMFSWAITDPDGDTLTCTLDIDSDGTPEYTINDCGNNTSQSHTYSAAGTYTPQLEVDDGNGGTDSDNVTVTITNAPPVINSLNAAPNPSFTNTAVDFSWNVSDSDGDTLTCTLDIDNDGAVDYTINDCANNTMQSHTYAVAGAYTAQFTVSDGNGGTAQQTITQIVINEPLEVAISFDHGPIVSGDRLIYTINVGNVSPAALDNVTVSLVVPTGLSFSKAANSEPNVRATACGAGSCIATHTAFWDLGTIPAGQNRVITVDALVAGGLADGTVISAPFTFTATNMADFTIFKDNLVQSTPDVQVAASASTDAVVPGQTFKYVVNVGNASGALQTNLQLLAILPDNLTVVDTDGGTDQGNRRVTWDITSLAAGGILQRELTVQVDNGSASGLPLPIHFALEDLTNAETYVSEHAVSVASADLPINLSLDSGASPDVDGERAIYTYTVANDSALPVDNVQVMMRVPFGMSFSKVTHTEPNVRASACGAGSCIATHEAFWDLGTIPPGESRTITVDALLSATLNSGDLVSMPVRVFSTGQPDDVNLIETIAINSTPESQLSVGASTDAVVEGQQFSYHIDLGNVSAGTLTGLQLRAQLPAGVTISDLDGGTDQGNGVVTWDVTSLGVGGSLHRDLTVTVDAGMIAGTLLPINVELTHSGALEVDNRSEFTVTVTEAVLPLKISLDSVASPDVDGERTLFTYTLANDSAVPADNVQVMMRVPFGISFSKVTHSEPNVDASVCGAGSCIESHEAVWDLGTIPPGESRTITVDALLSAALNSGDLVSMPVRVFSTGQPDDVNLVETFAINSTPESQLSLAASTDAVVADQQFSYHIDVGNVSAGTLTGLQLRAQLPAGVTIADTDGGTDQGNGVVTWDVATLGVGGSLHRDLTVTVDTDTDSGTLLSANVELTHSGALEVDNRSEFSVTVTEAVLPLKVSLDSAASPEVDGERALFTYTLANDSALPVDNVQVMMRVPFGISFSKAGASEPDVNATVCGAGSCIESHEAWWDLGTIPAGESRTITVDALLSGALNSGDLVSVPVRVFSTGQPDDVNLVETIAINSTPESQLTLGASTDAVVAGQQFSYHIDVGNVSAGTLTGLQLRAQLPAGVTIIGTDGGTDQGNGVVTWDVATLGVGGSLHRDLTVTVDAGTVAGTILAASVELTHSGALEVDNRAEFAVTTIDTALPISVGISVAPDPADPDFPMTYTFTVSNNSGLPVDAVTVQMRVPFGISFSKTADSDPDVRASACGAGSCIATHEAMWDLGTIAAGQSSTITVNANLSGALNSGDLIFTPVRVFATGLSDDIDLRTTERVLDMP